MSVNLGPIAAISSLKVPANPQADGLGHNPRESSSGITNFDVPHGHSLNTQPKSMKYSTIYVTAEI